MHLAIARLFLRKELLKQTSSCEWLKSCTTLDVNPTVAEILHHLGCQPNFEIMGVAFGSIKDAHNSKVAHEGILHSLRVGFSPWVKSVSPLFLVVVLNIAGIPMIQWMLGFGPSNSFVACIQY